MVEIISQKDRKARKTHTCSYCGDVIEVGEIYNHTVLKFDDIYTWDAHLKCIFVATELWDYIDPVEGMTDDDFQDGCNKFCRTFICPDCKQWDKDADECEKDEPFCVQKIYEFLQTHDFVRVRNEHNYFVWKCIPKKKDGDGSG